MPTPGEAQRVERARAEGCGLKRVRSMRLIERFLENLRVEGGLAVNTLKAYRRDLFKLLDFL